VPACSCEACVQGIGGLRGALVIPEHRCGPSRSVRIVDEHGRVHVPTAADAGKPSLGVARYELCDGARKGCPPFRGFLFNPTVARMVGGQRSADEIADPARSIDQCGARAAGAEIKGEHVAFGGMGDHQNGLKCRCTRLKKIRITADQRMNSIGHFTTR
jgi:hypothetical protein